MKLKEYSHMKEKNVPNVLWIIINLVSSNLMTEKQELPHSFSSLRFNVGVARRCFSWSSVSDDFYFRLVFFLVILLALSFSCLILSISFLCSSVSEALFALSFSFLSERFFFVMVKLI